MSLLRRWKILLPVGVLVVAALVYVGQDRWRDRCGASTGHLSAEELGSVLLPRERVAEEEPELVAALDGLPDPFGDVVAGRDFGGFASRPTVGAVDDRSVYLAGKGDWVAEGHEGQIVVVDPATGKARWGIGTHGLNGGGGPVGDAFVAAWQPEDRSPELHAYALDTGERVACTKLGKDVETGFRPALDSTAVSDGDVVTAHDQEDERVITRIDPDSGDRRWDRRITRSGGVALEDAGSVVVVAAHGPSDSLETGSVPPGLVHEVVALDERTGEVAWRWADTPPAEGSVMARIIGADAERGRVHAVERTWSDSTETNRLVTLDERGDELWSRKLAEYCDAALWGDLVVTACGQPAFTAYDAATGEERWSTPALDPPHRPSVGSDPAVDLGDGTRLQLAGDGLLRVDTATGKATEVVTEEALHTYVSGVEATAEHLVLSTGSGVFVLEREG